MKYLVECVLATLLCLFIGCQEPFSNMKPSHLRCEYMYQPQAIDVLNPRLTWLIEADGRVRTQTAYQILVASTPNLLEMDSGDLWNSKKCYSNMSVNVEYRGKALSTRNDCYWKVRIWDEKGHISRWSESEKWSIGMIKPEDWSAKWVGFDEALSDSRIVSKPWANGMKAPYKKEYRPLPCSYFRKDFSISKSPQNALVYITAQGIYELYINGQRVGEDFFTPGWTDYRKRIYYNTYDVTPLLQKCNNTIAAILADGWFAGNVGNTGQAFYGNAPRIKLELQALMDDGKTFLVQTDDSWSASHGPIREADLQGGETYNAQLELSGWNQVGFDDSQWREVSVSEGNNVLLQAYPSVTIQKTKEIHPVSIALREDGTYIVDMGQNFAGWARISAMGTAGDSIVMRFAEKLKSDGSIYTENLRTAHCTDTYVLKGGGLETWEPRFSYRGYQYIEISGYPGALTNENITGIVLHSNLPETGKFSCSNDLITKIYSNIKWSQRSNYFEVPTDNPQRDERLGWLADAHIFMRTASYNMDVASFFTKWLQDVVDAQMENGGFPWMAPRIFNGIAAGWGDAGVIIPYRMLSIYGDTLIVKKMYPHMVKWMDYLEQNHVNFVSSLNGFGDWQNVESETPKDLIATAYFKHNADLMSEMAKVSGKPEDVNKYRSLSKKIKQAFGQRFVSDSGVVMGNTQTGYLLSFSFDLLDNSVKSMAAGNLVEAITQNDSSLSTGLLGTHLLLPVLTELGELQLAYHLLKKKEFPSWGHQIENGATTIWERWDSYSKEKGFKDDVTNSLNQYALGSVGEWMYSTIAGIKSDGPGYKKIIIHPQPGGGLTWAEGEYLSIRGRIKSSWTWNKNSFDLMVVIPPNTSAKVMLPTSNLNSITESGTLLEETEGVNAANISNGMAVIEISSGEYHFHSTLN